MKKNTEKVVAIEAKFCEHNVKKEPDSDQNTLPSPLTGHAKGSSMTSEDDKRDKKKLASHPLKQSSSKENVSIKGSLDVYSVDIHKRDPAE